MCCICVHKISWIQEYLFEVTSTSHENIRLKIMLRNNYLDTPGGEKLKNIKNEYKSERKYSFYPAIFLPSASP